MTVKEVLQITADELGNIQVPAALIEQIGLPLAGCRKNLLECISAIERDEHKSEEAEENVPG